MAEMTVNEFINSMKDAGFDFKYTATNGEYIVKGKVDKSGEHSKEIKKIVKDNQ